MEARHWLRRSMYAVLIFSGTALNMRAQATFTLDSCRTLALQNNKQLNIAHTRKDVATNTRKAMRTKYLPKADFAGGYVYTGKEISLLSNRQKTSLGNLGSRMGSSISSTLPDVLTDMVTSGIITAQTAQQLGELANRLGVPLAEAGNRLGQSVADALRTDTRNLWALSVGLRQPIYMGGAITAANRMADLAEQMADDALNLEIQDVVYATDHAYWTVVSLRQKRKLAESYLQLTRQLQHDVHKMIEEGVATRADGLRVDVKVNEADMQVTQTENGVALAKMYLCQLCGLSPDKDIRLADEEESLIAYPTDLPATTTEEALDKRMEVRLLKKTEAVSKESTKLIRAEYLPHIALTGGYMASNPNVFNGFQRKLGGTWNVGIALQMPVWNWFEGKYKIRAAQASTRIAELETAEAKEKIELQIQQDRYKVEEARKRKDTATKNLYSADENLRCANLGFKEGVMDVADVMAAQTAWQQAQNQKIDAEIGLRLAYLSLQKSMGELHY